MPYKLLDLNQIDALTDGDMSFRRELIQTCLDLFRKFPGEFEAALATRNAEELEFVNHRIKANVLLVGADSVYKNLQDTKEQMEAVGLTAVEMQAAVAKVSQHFGQMEQELTATLSF